MDIGLIEYDERIRTGFADAPDIAFCGQLTAWAVRIGDERDLRFQRDQIGEVLVRPDAEVNPTRLRRANEIRDHPLIRAFVRDEVVGAEKAVGLGEIRDQLPERAVAQLRRDRPRRGDL